MLILSLETTCDETAAAVVNDRLEVLSSVVATQDKLHERFGGVVPEVASRAHVERILPVIDEALTRANVRLSDLAAIAVANTPGLAGSLLVGLCAAKGLCVATGLPLVAVNHLQAHIYACRMAAGEEVFPCVGFVVSGGHTSLYDCATPLNFALLGGTIDDAAGEAFDKVASLLGLPFPGGPSIERAGRDGETKAYAFPRSFIHDDTRLEFSFSGLKTAVRYELMGPGKPDPTAPKPTGKTLANLAASFEQAVVDCLLAKCLAAIRKTGYRTLCVGGGVAANTRFRTQLASVCETRRVRLHVPPTNYCTDNAVMGAIAFERLKAGLVEDLTLDVHPGLIRPKRPK